MDLALVFRKLRGYISLLFCLLSLFLMIACASDLMTGQASTPPAERTDVGVLFGMLVIFTLTTLLSAHRAWRDLGSPINPSAPHPNDADIQSILQLAQSERGCLTISEVAMTCKLPVDRSQILLTELVDKGIAVMEVSDNGAMLYRFPDFTRKQLH
jgi:hypothetical protein